MTTMQLDGRPADGIPGGIPWAAGAVVIAWIASAAVTYAAMTTRIAVVEDRYERIQADIVEIKNDLRSLIRVSGATP